MRQRMTISGLWVRALCALALMLAAFAHRPAQVTSLSPAELAAYVLPDGSLPVLCLPGTDGEGNAVHANHCEFCRIAASFDLPLPPANSEPAQLAVETAWLNPADQSIPPSGVPPSAPPRGPPCFRI